MATAKAAVMPSISRPFFSQAGGRADGGVTRAPSRASRLKECKRYMSFLASVFSSLLVVTVGTVSVSKEPESSPPLPPLAWFDPGPTPVHPFSTVEMPRKPTFSKLGVPEGSDTIMFAAEIAIISISCAIFSVCSCWTLVKTMRRIRRHLAVHSEVSDTTVAQSASQPNPVLNSLPLPLPDIEAPNPDFQLSFGVELSAGPEMEFEEDTRFVASECCVCRIHGANTANIPCGHVCLCYDCSLMLQAHSRQPRPQFLCPICRELVYRSIRLYAA